ncbi:MAG TPA: Nif3-like dinuclear metal center hexameric protein [Solirubrobacterales bacterium]|nr:Nif3-like dinuclear metal center hexameric protein [Solirubrobacterales bacterium]
MSELRKSEDVAMCDKLTRMADRDQIISFCDETLDAGSFTDYGPNGLQVPGAAGVTTLATCVSAHLESIEAAVDAGAQLLIAHHGLFWDFHPRSLSEPMAKRLRTAFDADLSVAGYHLPLDAHREIGNNALLAKALGFEAASEDFSVVKGAPIGVIGRRAEGIPAAELFDAVRSDISPDPLVFDSGPEVVRSIGITSGAAAASIHEAVKLGLDAFLTGEPAEHAMADAKEGGVHFIAAGHYATETLGVRRLGDLVAERFGIVHDFIDVPNPI